MRTLLPWIVYPSVLALSFGLHFLLLRLQVSLLASTFLPIFVSLAFVLLLERYLPHRPDWRPTKEDVKTDIWFMVTVQLILAKLLAFLAVIALIEPLRSYDFGISALWPHHWSNIAQALLMIVAGDFLRYWLHRASHNTMFLWRLHAVHHSPDKLYWLNVGRFHPLEKALQFFLDNLPFLLLGVSAEVIALYFLFYAVNGFFLHSNISLRYGVLNYVLNTAELHRWHHSVSLAEANHNFGNNTIIWDLLFGTFFLPKNRQVGRLGNNNKQFPQPFIKQLLAPFSKNLW